MWILFAFGVIGVCWAFWDAGRMRQQAIQEMRQRVKDAREDRYWPNESGMRRRM